MMLAPIAVVIALCLSAAGPKARLDSAKGDFARGDFQAALKALDAAVQEGGDALTLSAVQLLRAQCFAAQQDFVRAEDALAQALDSDAEAALDPARVDPDLVRLLDGLRGRTKGSLTVVSDRPGTKVTLDGAPIGVAPVNTQVPIGRHRLEGRTADGRFEGGEEVVVRARRSTEVSLALREASSQAAARRWHPFADVRSVMDLFQLPPGFEIGAGVEFPNFRAALHARILPDFGLTPRAALLVPVADRIGAFIELEVPFLFLRQVALGLGGSLGLEYAPSKWIGLFGQLGARHFFTGLYVVGDASRATAQLGLRLRMP